MSNKSFIKIFYKNREHLLSFFLFFSVVSTLFLQLNLSDFTDKNSLKELQFIFLSIFLILFVSILVLFVFDYLIYYLDEKKKDQKNGKKKEILNSLYEFSLVVFSLFLFFLIYQFSIFIKNNFKSELDNTLDLLYKIRFTLLPVALAIKFSIFDLGKMEEYKYKFISILSSNVFYFIFFYVFLYWKSLLEIEHIFSCSYMIILDTTLSYIISYKKINVKTYIISMLLNLITMYLLIDLLFH